MEYLSLDGVRAVSMRCTALLLLCGATQLLTAGAVSAQTMQDRKDALSAHLKQLQEVTSVMPKAAREKLSSGAQHVLQLAAAADSGELQSDLTQSEAALHGTLSGRPFAVSSEVLGFPQVNDSGTDLAFSRLGGFVHSETSTAWCGNNVVVGYNDSGSLLETFPQPNIGLSFNGYSRSTDGGRTFADQGYLNPGPNVFGFLQGDPVVVCTDRNTFYQASIYASRLFNAISVSISTDGGATFGDPISVARKTPRFHFLDKPWLAADPSNPNKLYVTYSDFDTSRVSCRGLRVGIELVRSVDGGVTWSEPTVVDSACAPDVNQGSNVAVDGAGNVYVAWESFPAALPTDEIDIVKSTDGGASFGHKVAVATVTPVGSTFFGLLQGGFRKNEFPILAIDRSRGQGAGPIYVTWNDGRFNQIADGVPPSHSGMTYNFGDVLVSRSTDGGVSWSAAAKVNSDSNGVTSPGADHYLPGIAVDRTGAVGVCWYDRRRDPRNFFIDRECAVSRNAGRTWRNHRITQTSFPPSIAADELVNPTYMGDYDTTAADTLGQASGFLGAYGDNTRGNPNVSITPRFGVGDDANNDE
jgi:hypothetical protein